MIFKKFSIFFIFFYFIFNIEGNGSSPSKFKPIEKIDLYIGKNIDSSYKSLKNYLTSNCSVTFGYDMQLDNNGYINSSFSEYEIINFLMKQNTSSLISCKKVKVDNLQILRFSFGTCNGKINNIDISIFKTRMLNNNILDQWLYYFKSFSQKKPNLNNESRTALISGENIKFVNTSKTWADKNDLDIFTVIYSSIEVAEKKKIVTGNKINFSQLKKCSKFYQ